MKFIYFYSPIYNFYDQHIKQTLSDDFEIESILIPDIQTREKGHTFLGGVSIKIELILEKIKQNKNQHIIFTDATIFLNKNNSHKLYTYFNSYMDNDICFADNKNLRQPYNIGIILIRCIDDIIIFFEEVLDELRSTKGWDQEIVNKKLLYNTKLKIAKFDEKILCGKFNSQHLESFLIFKSFIKHTNNIDYNYNQRIEQFLQANLITHNEYLNLKR